MKIVLPRRSGAKTATAVTRIRTHSRMMRMAKLLAVQQQRPMINNSKMATREVAVAAVTKIASRAAEEAVVIRKNLRSMTKRRKWAGRSAKRKSVDKMRLRLARTARLRNNRKTQEDEVAVATINATMIKKVWARRTAPRATMRTSAMDLVNACSIVTSGSTTRLARTSRTKVVAVVAAEDVAVAAVETVPHVAVAAVMVETKKPVPEMRKKSISHRMVTRTTVAPTEEAAVSEVAVEVAAAVVVAIAPLVVEMATLTVASRWNTSLRVVAAAEVSAATTMTDKVPVAKVKNLT